MTTHKDEQDPNGESDTPTRVPPIHNRFLFVDVAAMRAKQLRRGALPRLTHSGTSGEGHRLEPPLKLERIAMEEVTQGIISYDLPDLKTVMKGIA